MLLRYLLVVITISPVWSAAQLYVQKDAELCLQKNTTLTLQGDLEINNNISGEGTIELHGHTQQYVSGHGYSIPALQLDNVAGSLLSGAVRIKKRLDLKSGHLTLGRFNIELDENATVGGSASAYILTGEQGRVIKFINKNMDGFLLPLGTREGFAPMRLRSHGTYHNGRLKIATISKASPHKPASSKDYLQEYWTIDRTGITGELSATAFYSRQYTGSIENMQPHYWNGHQWQLRTSPIDRKNSQFSILVPEGTGEIYAMRTGSELGGPASSMQVFPNPVHNTAKIVIRSNAEENQVLRIIDNGGAVVMQHRIYLRKGINQVNLDITTLAKGHYIVSSDTKDISAAALIKQ